MRTLIDIPEGDIQEIKKITPNRSEFVRKAIRMSLDSQRPPESDIDQFFGIFSGNSEDGVAFQDRMRSEW
jgi:metal-responsive CopG/Arc/MetJ family transcriptional regulator